MRPPIEIRVIPSDARVISSDARVSSNHSPRFDERGRREGRGGVKAKGEKEERNQRRAVLRSVLDLLRYPARGDWCQQAD